MWDIVEFEEEHFREMLDMTIEYYGENNDISNEGFVRHEYFNNPYGNAFIKLAYDHENKCLAGQYIVIPRDILINGVRCESVLSLNTLTRSSYRGQQVFTRLAEAVYREGEEQDVSFCYGAPNQNSFPGFIKKLEFTKMGDVPLYLKILNPFQVIADKLSWSKNMSMALRLNKDIVQTDNINIVTITNENVSLFDQYWQRIFRKYPVIGIRDAEYIRWRYIDIPLRDYQILMAIKEGTPQGYIIGRISEVSHMRCGMIVDFLVDEYEVKIGICLLNSLIKNFRKSRVGLLGCLMQETCEESKFLRKTGFFKCPDKLLPQPFPIIYRKLNALSDLQSEIVEDFSNWFFTMGDYDVI